METLIDITPQAPLPTPTVGPLDRECVKEGLIVCDRQKIKGEQGVSLDELVGIFTRLGREMEAIGISKSYTLAEKVASVLQEAKPLLAKVQSVTFLLHVYFVSCIFFVISLFWFLMDNDQILLIINEQIQSRG